MNGRRNIYIEANQVIGCYMALVCSACFSQDFRKTVGILRITLRLAVTQTLIETAGTRISLTGDEEAKHYRCSAAWSLSHFLSSVLGAVCSVLCAVCSVQCAVCSVQFVVCSVQLSVTLIPGKCLTNSRISVVVPLLSTNKIISFHQQLNTLSISANARFIRKR